MMRGYTEITSQQQFDALLDELHGFHDSLLKEVHLINRRFAEQNWTLGEYRLDAQIFIQGHPSVELVCYRIIGLDLTDYNAAEIFSASGKVKEDIQVVALHHERRVPYIITLQLDDMAITAERIFFRLRPDWLGRDTRLNGQVPSPDAITAIPLEVEGNWRQCTNCFEAWQEQPQISFSLCPTCNNLTELKL